MTTIELSTRKAERDTLRFKKYAFPLWYIRMVATWGMIQAMFFL